MINNSAISGANIIANSVFSQKNNSTAIELTGEFGRQLESALQKLQGQQNEVDQLSSSLAMGNMTDVHNVMIASEKMLLGLELTVQVRNKVIEAYQEIMRIQI